jgi:hypothetical protein
MTSPPGLGEKNRCGAELGIARYKLILAAWVAEKVGFETHGANNRNGFRVD